MKNNEELQKDVQNAIKWEPLLYAAEIGVTANGGVITLTGTVDSYAKKLEAEVAAKNVAGVKAVVEKIELKFHSDWTKRDDNDIANDIVSAFKWNWQIPSNKIKVRVENGWITLDGEANWNYQREAAKDVVKNVEGILGVSNNITIKSANEDKIEKDDIESALKRNWSTFDENIAVGVADHKVKLTGTVEYWYQKEEAGRMAWSAPGVWSVENDLEVEFKYE